MSAAAAGLYGEVPPSLVEEPEDPVQFSPLVPGSPALESAPDASLAGFVVAAPPGTVERRAVIAQALRATQAGARVTVLAPKDRGGSRLRRELEGFGCAVDETARRHHRVCELRRPARPEGLGEAVAAGAPRLVEALGLWSQPGIFSWDRVDPGSALLAAQMKGLSGRGADLGCGAGWLGARALATPKVAELALVDRDRRAVECARRNLADARARFAWTDLRRPDALREAGLAGLDFVVMNPPFHAAGAEDRTLGQAFIRAAAGALKRGGVCWLVANRHLPYETVLGELFKEVTPGQEGGGFKVFRARK